MTDEQRHEFTRALYGWITHTELSSTEPEATRAWCAEVLGWKFQPPFPSPAGDYHLFAYSESGGGGIGHTEPGSRRGRRPRCNRGHAGAYDAALAAGAESVNPPETVMEGIRIALVRAPGGVLDRLLRAHRLTSSRCGAAIYRLPPRARRGSGGGVTRYACPSSRSESLRGTVGTSGWVHQRSVVALRDPL